MSTSVTIMVALIIILLLGGAYLGLVHPIISNKKKTKGKICLGINHNDYTKSFELVDKSENGEQIILKRGEDAVRYTLPKRLQTIEYPPTGGLSYARVTLPYMEVREDNADCLEYVPDVMQIYHPTNYSAGQLGKSYDPYAFQALMKAFKQAYKEATTKNLEMIKLILNILMALGILGLVILSFQMNGKLDEVLAYIKVAGGLK